MATIMLYLMFACILASVLTCSDAQCVEMYSSNRVDTYCVRLFDTLRYALLESEVNRFILPEVFYPESRVQPNLVKVEYNLTCPIECPENNNFSCTEQNVFVFGWSQTPIFGYFHAAIVNQLRYQLPFWIMAFARPLLSSEPNTEALMWVGKPGMLSLLSLTLELDNCSDIDHQNLEQALYSLTEYVSHIQVYLSHFGTYMSLFICPEHVCLAI